MNSYKNLNNIFGWLAFLIAMIVYILTVEPSVSLWDCGEFIAASEKLQVVHPPGAPFFLLMGRLFSLFAGDPTSVAWSVNMLSVISSALTVLFTFWITTYFAKKMLSKDEEPTGLNQVLILGAGMVAGLTLTFCDTFWFSAVEAEVYALSSFFTALTFWVMLKWEQNAEKPGADRWIVFAFYLVGLAIGTHLLNLLVIPAMAYIFYFKRFKTTSKKGMIYTFLIGLGILFFIQKAVIPGIVWLLAYTDKAFVNSMGMPFWSGAIFLLFLIVALLVFGIRYTSQNNKYYHNLALVCLTFVLIGYSSYTMVVVRSAADPAIDMNDPDDPFNLLSYINREQYGDRPLVYGPHFNAQPTGSEKEKTIYKMGEDNDGSDYYIEAGEKFDYKFNSKDKTIFPRMGDRHKEGGDKGYRYWSGMRKTQEQIDQYEQLVQQKPDDADARQTLERLKAKKPSFGNNIRFFVSYQLGHMWWRYFMWNFAGRQNDQQGHSYNRYVDGNWISGVGFIDNIRLGKQSKLPSDLKSNKGRNKYYFLPLLLGILGLWYHYKKGKSDFIVTMALFIFTGILIIVFLNQPPFEPRERDYTNVGSTQTFCIWVGLGVLGLAQLIRNYLDKRTTGIVAIVVSLLAAPVLMAKENWDDHDRSERYLGIDFANNYLESCPENAILFCNGDNDTYPLWYAQNVEGKRQDVRIINMALLPTDWYAGALLRDVYKSEQLPLTITHDYLKRGDNDVIYYVEDPAIDQTKYALLDKVIEFVKDPSKKQTFRNGEVMNYLPTRKFKVKVDKEAVKRNKVVMEKEYSRIVDEMLLDYPKGHMTKGDIVLFDLIAQNAKTGWKRPICFTATTGASSYLGLQSYFQQEGLVHKLVPIKSALQGSYPVKLADDVLYDNIMNKYKWAGIKEKEDFFLDDKAMLVPQTIRGLMYRLAAEYYNNAKTLDNQVAQVKAMQENGITIGGALAQIDVADNQRKSREAKEKAIRLICKSLVEMPFDRVPLRTQSGIQYLDICNKLGLKEDAAIIKEHLVNDANEKMDWVKSISKRQLTLYMKQLAGSSVSGLQEVVKMAKQNGDEDAETLEQTMNSYYTKLQTL